VESLAAGLLRVLPPQWGLYAARLPTGLSAERVVHLPTCFALSEPTSSPSRSFLLPEWLSRQNPLTRLGQHAGRWYYVYIQAWPVATRDDARGPQRWAQVNRLADTLTDALPPHGTRRLTKPSCWPCVTIPLPRIAELWLE
jgi:hypothetical protein